MSNEQSRSKKKLPKHVIPRFRLTPLKQSEASEVSHERFSLADARDKLERSLVGIGDYMREVESLATIARGHNLSKFTRFVLDRISDYRNAGENDKPLCNLSIDFYDPNHDDKPVDTMEIPLCDTDHVDKVIEYSRSGALPLWVLGTTSIQFIANSVEQFLGDVLRAVYLAKPTAIPKDRTIRYADLVGLSNVDDLLSLAVESEVAEFGRLSSEEQFEKLIKFVTVANLRECVPCVDDILEMLLRRHAIVHANEIASPEYIRRIRALAGFDSSELKVGSALTCKQAYLRDIISKILFFGAVTIELVEQQMSRKDKAALEKSQWALNQFGFDAMLRADWNASRFIFEYATKHARVDRMLEGMALINYAISLRRCGSDEEGLKIVEKEKWTAASATLRLGASAVRNDFDDFCVELRACQATADFALTADEMHEWPAFQWVKLNPKFDEIVATILGKAKIKPSQDDLYSLLVDAKAIKHPRNRKPSKKVKNSGQVQASSSP